MGPAGRLNVADRIRSMARPRWRAHHGSPYSAGRCRRGKARYGKAAAPRASWPRGILPRRRFVSRPTGIAYACVDHVLKRIEVFQILAITNANREVARLQ